MYSTLARESAGVLSVSAGYPPTLPGLNQFRGLLELPDRVKPHPKVGFEQPRNRAQRVWRCPTAASFSRA